MGTIVDASANIKENLLIQQSQQKHFTEEEQQQQTTTTTTTSPARTRNQTEQATMMRAKTIITVMVLLAVAMIAVPSADATRSLNFSKFRSKDKKDATPEAFVQEKSEMPEPMAPEPEPEVNIESQTEMPEPMAPESEPEVNIESQTEKQQDSDADVDADADGEEKSSGSEVLSHFGADKDKCWSPLWNKHVHHGQMGAEKCCWYGDWTHKSKCDGHDHDEDKKYVVKSDQDFPSSAKTTFKSRKSFFDAYTKCCAYIQGDNQNANGWECTYQEENQTKFCYNLDVKYADTCF